ncbi:MAG: alpha-galactosidase [Clostridia bacterium]|nr:alpha-galactosidase [Clostridia bacterium]
MSISFCEHSKTFHLTDHKTFSCILRIADDPAIGQNVYQLHWGAPVQDAEMAYLADETALNLASFDTGMQLPAFICPTSGRGDFRPAAIQAIGADGTDCVFLTYEKHEIIKGKPVLNGLPHVYTESDDEAETLKITLCDRKIGLKAEISYTVHHQLHAMTENIQLTNDGEHSITLHNPASACITLRGGYDMLHLHGAWTKERYPERIPAMHGIREISSTRGASGHQHNPFVALMPSDTTEFAGECYGMCLVYSGSFRMLAEQNAYGYTRFIGGLNECTWNLLPGENLQTPEMMLVYSNKGINGMSHIFHKMIRTRICRGIWRDQPRPVLVNNWEGTYFDFNTEKLLAIAQKASEIGVELFVLDDGWFGKRNNDNCSLGDWVVNEEKLPGGIGLLADKVNALGLKFGLWFEPEMISPDSDLYRAHPDWCLHVPGRPRSERRNQLILDLSRTDVQEYIINAVSSVLESANIEYVKWDMNRNFAEAGSAVLSASQQGELHHRYMLGLYRVLEAITSRFPHVLFESCSGGGGRFDAGMLYYMPQTWTSDDTDAVERLFIQYGTSIPYPPASMGAHVSAVPNHQVLRNTSLTMRGHVAMSGNFGYELDLSKMTENELEEMKAQVAFIKANRKLTQQGRFTRLASPFDGSLVAWQFTSEDQSELLLCMFRRYIHANEENHFIRIQDVDENAWYEDEECRRYHGSVLKSIGLLPKFPLGDGVSQILKLHKV